MSCVQWLIRHTSFLYHTTNNFLLVSLMFKTEIFAEKCIFTGEARGIYWWGIGDTLYNLKAVYGRNIKESYVSGNFLQPPKIAMILPNYI